MRSAFDEDKSGMVDHDEFKAGLAMIGFEPSEKELGEVLAIVDKDNDGEVDYEEFASRISKILGDEDFKQDSGSELGATPSAGSADRERPATAGSSVRMEYKELYNPYEERARPRTAPVLPRGVSQGSWLSRSAEGLGSVGGTKKQVRILSFNPNNYSI